MLKLVIINKYSGPIKSSIDNKLRDIRKSYRVKAKLSSAGYMEKEGTHQGGPKTAGIVPRDSDSYRLYFKGLVREDTRGFLAGFGVAICDQDDNLVFQMKGSLHYSAITVLEVELKALKRGLTEAVSLGITHISICCDHNKTFELVSKYVSKFFFFVSLD